MGIVRVTWSIFLNFEMGEASQAKFGVQTDINEY